MKPSNLPVSHNADTMITGVRESEPRSAPREPSGTMSGRHGSTRSESWVAEDGPESELPVPTGTLLGGKYSVERVFAEGGMGVVCLGRHVQLEQPVAIKFLRQSLAGRPAIAQRFLNEARALAALRSEHVVRVMDVGELDSGRPYLVMEHLDGVHLDALLERDGALSVETAVSYALQVCEPLSEAHALGIVHRDIKPENLFLWSGGPTADSIKVLDFGLAKQLGSAALGVTGPQDSLGSPGYMSPEQVTTPHLVDARSDIWSLGVVLYRLLGNVSPFDGGSLVEVLSHILNAAPLPLHELAPAVDAELEAIVMRCLEKSPDARFQTMSQLADALNAYLEARRRPSLTAEGSTPPTAPVAEEDKLRIAGVHSRWPALAVALGVLLSASAYFAARNDGAAYREVTAGWLTPLRLRSSAMAVLPSSDVTSPPPLFRGVLTGASVRGADGHLTLRAASEREATAESAEAVEDSATIGDAERARRVARYREYLKSEGLTRLSEAAEPGAADTEAVDVPKTEAVDAPKADALKADDAALPDAQ